MAYPNTSIYRIPHYHGDTVRSLFLVTVGFSFLVIPLWGHILPFGNTFEVLGGIVLIALAGLTSPHSRFIMLLNCLVSGLGAFLLELSAISFRSSESLQLLLVREIEALILITALYFSVKTARAMMQGKVGQLPRPWEFDTVDKSDTSE